MVQDITKKLTSIDILRSSDFGGVVVGGLDRMDIGTRIGSWQEEVADTLDGLKAFEVF